MQQHTKKFLLQFALDSIARIESYIEGLSFDAWTREVLRYDATMTRLKFIGFSLRDLNKRYRIEQPKNYCARKAQKINVLTKDYRKIDSQKIWATVTLDLPNLKRKLLALSLRGALSATKQSSKVL